MHTLVRGKVDVDYVRMGYERTPLMLIVHHHACAGQGGLKVAIMYVGALLVVVTDSWQVKVGLGHDGHSVSNVTA